MLQQQETNHRTVSQSLKFPMSFTSSRNNKPCPQISKWHKETQPFSTQPYPSGPLFLLLVFTFLSSIRHKLFMAKLPLTMFMQCLAQWNSFSAGASGHSCNTNNHDDSNNNKSQLCCSHQASTASVCATELRSLYFTAGSQSLPQAILQ